jgi:hypothetical protein
VKFNVLIFEVPLVIEELHADYLLDSSQWPSPIEVGSP